MTIPENTKLLLIGATGNVGQRILKEALDRGYKVTAMQRNPEKLKIQHRDLKVIKGDLLAEANLPALLKDQSIIISAISARAGLMEFKIAYQNLITALDRQTDKRLIIVGGAGNTEITPGIRVVNDAAVMAQLPKEWIPDILKHSEVLELLKNSNINWTYFSPAKDFEAGQRTGKYRLGTTNMIFDANGESKISYEDYAVAVCDEIKNGHFIKRQFSIGY